MLAAGGAAVVAGGYAWARGPEAIPLYGETVVFAAPGARRIVPPGAAATVAPGSRVLARTPHTERLLQEQADWLAGLAPWVRARAAADDAVRDALLDVWVLSAGLPAGVAAWSPRWRYAWPRDVSFTAAALATVGRPADAVAMLAFFDGLERADGWLEARYRLDTRRTPDGRARQLDGTAWLLWAASRILAASPDAPLGRVRGLLTRCAGHLLATRDPRTGLPPVSQDWWEVPERQLTLGIAASVLAGLRCAEELLPHLGEPGVAEECGSAAADVESRLPGLFGRSGWTRYPGGTQHDASLTFLLPPLGRLPVALLAPHLDRAERALIRPAGGLAPGAGWHEGTISWTPATALFALCRTAIGDASGSDRLVGWLDAHRTSAGSFPEKVLPDGRPAAVAPLAWTAALRLLVEAERRPR